MAQIDRTQQRLQSLEAAKKPVAQRLEVCAQLYDSLTAKAAVEVKQFGLSALMVVMAFPLVRCALCPLLLALFMCLCCVVSCHNHSFVR